MKEKVQVEYNRGSELDFGYGFYLTPKFDQAKRYINRMIPYLPKKSIDGPIHLTLIEEGVFLVILDKNHEYDFIIGVMTDANPIKLLLNFRNGSISKSEVIYNFEKGNSMQQLSLHNQAICDYY